MHQAAGSVQVEEPPVSDGWIQKIKYDVFRTQLILDWVGARACQEAADPLIHWISRVFQAEYAGSIPATPHESAARR